MRQPIVTLFFLFLNVIYSLGQDTSIDYWEEGDSLGLKSAAKGQKEQYYWLENEQDQRTIQWYKERRKDSINYSYRCDQDKKLYSRIRSFLNTETIGYSKIGPYFLFFKSSGWPDEPYTIWFKKSNNELEEDTLLFDPTSTKEGRKWKSDIVDVRISDNWKFMAIVLSVKESKNCYIRIINLETKKLIPDFIGLFEFKTLDWYENGFFYLKENNSDSSKKIANPKPRLYYHSLFSNQISDKLVYSSENVFYDYFDFKLSSKKDRIILKERQNLDGKSYIVFSSSPLDSTLKFKIEPIAYFPKSVYKSTTIVDLWNNELYLKTFIEAKNGKVVAYKVGSAINQGRVAVPEKFQVLDEFLISRGKYFCVYFENGKDYIQISDTSNNILKQIDFPVGIHVSGMNNPYREDFVVLNVRSFFSPNVFMYLDCNSLETSWFSHAKIPFDRTKFESKYVNFTSKDGTIIPMYISYKKGIRLDGNNPVQIYCKGVFGLKSKPFYSISNMVWMDCGGVFVIPLIRGGSELGEDWHLQAIGTNKMKSIEDLIGAANYLIKENYTNPKKIALVGNENAGWLVNIASVRFPNLFKAVISENAYYDLADLGNYLNSELFDLEFGNAKDSTEFLNLLKFSSTFGIKQGTSYPSYLLVSGKVDNEFPHFQTTKYVASLLSKSKVLNPVLFYNLWNSKTVDNRSSFLYFNLEYKKLLFLINELKVHLYWY
jgi:prolyl oligopeptidase